MRKRESIRMLSYLALAILLSLCLIKFGVQRTDIHGDSMAPVLINGDSVFTDKFSYLVGKPERFDIVVFDYVYREDQHYVKRVIGLPGETIQIMDGSIWIDGARVRENYDIKPIEDPRRAAEPITLGEDEYFVLGDNRDVSADSRDSDIANVNADQIIGRAFMRFLPLHRIGFLR